MASIREYKKKSLLTPLFVTLEVILEVLIPFFMAGIIDIGLANADMPYTIRMGIILVVAAALSLICGALSGKFAFVLITIIISAIAGMAGPLFLLYLIDDFITPLIGQQNPDFTRLFYMVVFFGCIYLIGVICTYTYNRLMVNIGQGVLKRVRDEMFSHMQTLPIRCTSIHISMVTS